VHTGVVKLRGGAGGVRRLQPGAGKRPTLADFRDGAGYCRLP
jgi:hypothetical protein